MMGSRILLRVAGDAARSRGRLAGLILSLLALAAARLYLTWLVKLWAEEIRAGRDEAQLHFLITLAGLVTAGLLVAVFASQYLMSSVNQRLIERLRNAAQGRLLDLRLDAVRRRQSGDLLARVLSDAEALSAFAPYFIRRLLGDGVLVLGAIVMMFYIEWRLALATCVVVPLVGVVLGVIGRGVREAVERAQQTLGTMSATLEEQLRGLTTIKGFQTEALERDRFRSRTTAYRRYFMHGQLWASALLTMVWFVTGFGLIGVLWYGTHELLAGRLTSGALLAFCLYAVQTVEPLRTLSHGHTVLQTVIAAAARLYEVIDLPGEEDTRLCGAARAPRGAVRFDAVTFGYRSGEGVLESLSFEVGAGEAVALAAASGGGKSTLARLLVRFYDPQRGRIRLDGADLRSLPLSHVRRAVCVVEQEPFIFSGSLLENIRYGTDARHARLDEAVALAGLESLLQSLPRGLHAHLQQAGHDLSGGQKQRIALARAIVREPTVLVLDEATSALDSDTEGQIFAKLHPWLAQRTVLIMAHRLSTIRRFGRIIVMERGRVAGDGSFHELLARCPAFSELFAEQIEVGTRTEPAAAAL